MFGMCSVMQCSSPASLHLLSEGIWACIPLSMSLLGFGMGIMLANAQMCGIMLLLRTVLSMLLRNASRRGPLYFRCMMFSL